MRCMECAAAMAARRESYLYDREGIKATLVDVLVHRCPACGDFEVEIPRLEDLNRSLAAAIIDRSARLSGVEIRFLRKSLGWSGTELARHMGVDRATVSRWETGAQEIGQVADRLVRLLVSIGTPVKDYPLSRLAALGTASAGAGDSPLRFKASPRGWVHLAA